MAQEAKAGPEPPNDHGCLPDPTWEGGTRTCCLLTCTCMAEYECPSGRKQTYESRLANTQCVLLFTKGKNTVKVTESLETLIQIYRH